MVEKKLAVIGASYMAAIFIDKAKAMGIKTYCFAWDKGAVAKEHADVFFPISVMEKELIAQKCKELNVDGVICTTEAPISTCGYLVNHLGLIGNKEEIADNVTNKGWVRKRVDSCSLILQPNYLILTSELKMDNLAEIQHPVVIKPVCGGGKRGVVVCDDNKNLNKCIEYAFSNDNRNKGILIEDYISNGKEYSVESLSFKGVHNIIQITEKISSGPPHCVELGHHQPAMLSESIWNKVSNAIKELLDTVSIENGPCHTEIKIVDEDIYLIELNARPGGDHIATKLTELSTGYDYIGNCIRVALGDEPETYDDRIKKYAGVYFVTKQTAYLKDIFDDCENEEWLYEKHVENVDLDELVKNDCTHTNYMIYYSDERIEMDKYL